MLYQTELRPRPGYHGGRRSGEGRFTVHKSILTKTSGFFKACCDGAGQWKETTSRTVELPESDAETFPMYIQRLYTSELVLDDKIDQKALKKKDFNTKLIHEKLWASLLKLAVLADQINDAEFSNSIVDWMILADEKLLMLPNMWIRSIYSDLPDSSPERRLVVDDYMTSAKEGLFQEQKDNLPKDFLIDVLGAYQKVDVQNEEVEDVSWRNRCNYHIHADGTPRCT